MTVGTQSRGHHQRAREVQALGDHPAAAVVRQRVADDVRELHVDRHRLRVHGRKGHERSVVADKSVEIALVRVEHGEFVRDGDEAASDVPGDGRSAVAFPKEVCHGAVHADRGLGPFQFGADVAGEQGSDEEASVRVHGNVLFQSDDGVRRRFPPPVHVAVIGGIEDDPLEMEADRGGDLVESECGVVVTLFLSMTEKVDDDSEQGYSHGFLARPGAGLKNEYGVNEGLENIAQYEKKWKVLS